MPPAIKVFIIACAVMFVIQGFFPAQYGYQRIQDGDTAYEVPVLVKPGIEHYLGLVPAMMWESFWFWQLATFNLLHAGFFHILINLFVLWMFGSELERKYGTRRFAWFMVVAGVGAGLTTAFAMPRMNVPTIGASGIVFGVLLAYAVNYPNRYLYLYFLFPVKAKWVVLGLAIMELFASISGSQPGIANIAHLGGMLFGYLYLRYDRSFFKLRDAYYRRKLSRLKKKYKVYDGGKDREDKDKTFH